MNPVRLWRVFPWDPAAAEGEPFSATHVPGGQGGNRFDLPGSPRGVIDLAESEDHAVAELLQGFRNSRAPLTEADLTRWGRRLALVSVELEPATWPRVADLCDPATLGELGITTDQPPLRDRRRTQQIAVALHGRGYAGLRWWSAFWGEWHTVVLFRDRLTATSLAYGRPTPLSLDSPAVVDAARLLDIG